MKTYYDSFVLCKSNRNTYIQPHTVMKSRYTNVKYHCEISWYFSVHCLLQSLRNYKEEARIKPSEEALAMPGQQALELQVCIQAGHHVATAASSGALITTWSPWQLSQNQSQYEVTPWGNYDMTSRKCKTPKMSLWQYDVTRPQWVNKCIVLT